VSRAGAIVAAVALIVGLAADGVGIAGAIGDWGSTTTVKTLAAAPVTTTTPAAPSTTAPTTTAPTTTAPTTTTPAPSESPEDLVAVLNQAITERNTDVLLARLHPAVIARYGVEVCRNHVSRFGSQFTVLGPATAPADYSYASDGQTTVVPDTIGLPVRVTQAGTTPADAIMHIAIADGTLRFFTDCSPQAG
jgi:hypothetical protein